MLNPNLSVGSKKKWGPKKLRGLPKIRELILGNIPRTQPPDPWSMAASPTRGLSPGSDDPLSRPSLLQVIDVCEWLNWQDSQENLAIISEGGSWAHGLHLHSAVEEIFICRFCWEAGSSVLHLLMSVLRPLHTVLYQYTYIMHRAWCVTWCVKKNHGLQQLSR